MITDTGDRPEALAGVDDVVCDGRTALVTGSTSGIGRAVALALGRLGAAVIVHGRDVDAGVDVVDELGNVGAEATFVRADFSDPEDVRELAATVRGRTDGVDLLFANAGGLFRSARLTDLGVEYTFHVNHLGPFLLTAELAGHLTEDARVVTTASAAHRGVSFDPDRVERVDSYSPTWAYGHSKLANVLFARELGRRLSDAGRSIPSNAVHPGAIPESGFARFLPRPLPSVVASLEALPGVASVADGAAELLYVGLSPRTADVTGRYFAGQSERVPSSAATNDRTARRLWEYSVDRLDLDEPVVDGPSTTG